LPCGICFNKKKKIFSNLIFSIVIIIIIDKYFIINLTNCEFRDWVGGRYSVWSAIGMLPISLMFGYDVAQDFLDGGEKVDSHLLANINNVKNNIPLLLGFIGFYNTTIEGFTARAILPYCQVSIIMY